MVALVTKLQHGSRGPVGRVTCHGNPPSPRLVLHEQSPVGPTRPGASKDRTTAWWLVILHACWAVSGGRKTPDTTKLGTRKRLNPKPLRGSPKSQLLAAVRAELHSDSLWSSKLE